VEETWLRGGGWKRRGEGQCGEGGEWRGGEKEGGDRKEKVGGREGERGVKEGGVKPKESVTKGIYGTGKEKDILSAQ